MLKELTQTLARFSKAQMRIQQMAFMLVAVIIFFSMVALIYFSISSANAGERAEDLAKEEAQKIAKKLAGAPEFAFTSESCPHCIDWDKANKINPDKYKNFWNLDYLAIEKIYPEEGIIYIIGDSDSERTVSQGAFVSLVSWDETLGFSGDFKHEFGRVHASAKKPKT